MSLLPVPLGSDRDGLRRSGKVVPCRTLPDPGVSTRTTVLRLLCTKSNRGSTTGRQIRESFSFPWEVRSYTPGTRNLSPTETKDSPVSVLLFRVYLLSWVLYLRLPVVDQRDILPCPIQKRRGRRGRLL